MVGNGKLLSALCQVLQSTRKVALTGRPMSRPTAAWSHFYKCRGALRKELADPARWALTGFDGDTSL